MTSNTVSSGHNYTARATKGFAWNHLYKLTEFGMLNLFNMLIARHFGPEESVPYVVYTALGTIITAIAAFGIDGALLRFLPRVTSSVTSSRTDIITIGASGLRSFVRRMFALRMLIVAFILVCVALLFIILPSYSNYISLGTITLYAPYLLVFLAAQAVIAFSSCALTALLETRSLFITSIITRSVLVIIGVYLVVNHILAIDTAIVLHVLSAIATACILLYILFQKVNLHDVREEKRGIKRSLKTIVSDILHLLSYRNLLIVLTSPVMIYGLTTYGNDMLSAVLGRQPDILMLRAFYGENAKEVGVYNVTSLLLVVTEYVFFLGLGGAIVSIFSKLAHEDEKDGEGKYPRLLKARFELAGFQNIALLPLCGFMMLFAFHVVRVLYGDKYDASVLPFQIGLLLLALNVSLFTGGLAITSLVAIGKPRIPLYSRITWGAINVIGNVFLIKYYGVLGAVIGTNACNMLACATEDHFARKYIGSAIRYKPIFITTVVTILAASVSWYLDRALLPELNLIVRVCISGLLYFTLVYGIFWIVKLPEFVYLQRRILSLKTK